MRNAGLDETQAGIKIARRNINNLRYADDTTLMAESDLVHPLLQDGPTDDQTQLGRRLVLAVVGALEL